MFVLLYRELCLVELRKRGVTEVPCAFHIATKTDVLFDTCSVSFPSAYFGASLRFTTNLKNSLSVLVWKPLSLFLYSHSVHNVTRATLWTEKKMRRKKKKKLVSPTRLCLPSRRLFPRHLCVVFRGEKLAGCPAGSRLSPVLGNHFSLYWFRCLNLSVSVCHAFCR